MSQKDVLKETISSLRFNLATLLAIALSSSGLVYKDVQSEIEIYTLIPSFIAVSAFSLAYFVNGKIDKKIKELKDL